MFYQDHRKYYKGDYGKLKLNIYFQSLGGQFYTLFFNQKVYQSECIFLR